MSAVRPPDPAMEAWIAEAKAVPVADALPRLPNLKRIGRQMEGPCPVCGTTVTRFLPADDKK